jgi:hypothetical protein
MAEEYELGTVGPIPTVNPNVARIGEMLKIAKKYADQYYVKDYVPLIGGTTLGEFLLGKAPEEIERWGQGDYPFRNPNEVVRTGGNRLDVFKAGRFEPLLDVALNVALPATGAAQTAARVTKNLPIGASIMGPESATWKPEMAFQAGKMEAKGAKPEEILEATGMVRGLDNQWRTELSDQFAKMKQKGNSFSEQYMAAKDIDPLQVHLIKAEEAKYGRSPPELHKMTDKERNDYDIFRMQKIEEHGRMSKAPVTVKDVFEHPELLKAYPFLGNIKVEVGSGQGGVKGSYNQKENKLTIAAHLSPEEARSTMLHELTHGIQGKEEFNRGANAYQLINYFAKEKLATMGQIESLNKEASTALKAGDKNKYDELMAQRDQLSKKYMAMDPEKMGYEAYAKHGGEAEARMVQNRMNLSSEELRQNFPYRNAPNQYGLDINPDEAIITTKTPGTINQPSQSLDIKGFKDEGNFRRVGEPQSNLEKFGIAGNDQTRLPGGLIENAGRITRRSNPDDIAKQTEFIQANLNNPEFNKALALAQKHNPDFDLRAIKDMPESSLGKQHSIARTYDLLTKDSVSPQLKNAIFDDYMTKYPDMMKQYDVKDYDDLVEKSYAQLRKEVDQQFDDMVKGGMKLSYHQGDANYLDSREMLRDALVNNHLYTYRGGDVHPLLNDMDEFYGLNSNEKFRAVHDFFGHGTTGATFGRKGEETAYGAHAQTLSPMARIAAAAETRGQNSFVNYSGINADLEQKMMSTRIARDQAKHRGESVDQYDAILRDLGGQWQYAKQQGVALPPDMLEAGYKGEMPDYIKGNLFPEYGVSHKGYHYSNLSDLESTDPAKYGYGIRGAEAKRLALPGSIKERTYFYNEPGMREPGLGRNQYEADLNHFYDTEADPAGIIRMADNFNRDKYGILDSAGKANDIERMMREAGYHGYFNQNTGVGISFEPQIVREYSRE